MPHLLGVSEIQALGDGAVKRDQNEPESRRTRDA